MNDDVQIVQRCELKYYIDIPTSVALRRDMASILVHDEFSSNGAYRVKSLYFDTLNDDDFYTKDSGDNIRKKIRLRIYDEDMQKAKLEWKAKEGQFQHKHSLWVSREDAIALNKGDFSVLKKYNGDDALRLYVALVADCYRPVVIVEYDREAFMHPLYKTRITFDSNIRSSETDLNLFGKKQSMIPVLNDLVVLEVKYNEKLPEYISKVLKKYNITNTSVSKYVGSRFLKLI